jgi:hypothetical protein
MDVPYLRVSDVISAADASLIRARIDDLHQTASSNSIETWVSDTEPWCHRQVGTLEELELPNDKHIAHGVEMRWTGKNEYFQYLLADPASLAVCERLREELQVRTGVSWEYGQNTQMLAANRYDAALSGHFMPHRDIDLGGYGLVRSIAIISISPPDSYLGGDLILNGQASMNETGYRVVAERRQARQHIEVPFAAAVVFDNFSCVHGISALSSGTRYSINLRSGVPIPQLVVPEGLAPSPVPQIESQQQETLGGNSPSSAFATGYTKRVVRGYTKRVDEAAGGGREAMAVVRRASRL